MITREQLSHCNVLVLGYAMSGKSVAKFLLDNHAQVTINDRGDLSKDPSVHLLLDRGAKVVDGGNPVDLLDERAFDFIVKNPGIPYDIPLLVEAERRHIPIFTDIELASWYAVSPIISITGSNGKTTTTALTQAILSHQPKGKALTAGNIGVPTLDIVEQASEDDIIVMETSSFQLEGTQEFHPHIAVITNIYEAHLDYHGTREKYVAAKLKNTENLTDDDYLVYNYEQEELSHLVTEFDAKLIPFATHRVDDFVKQNGIYLKENNIYFRNEYIMSEDEIQIPGGHNVENVLAALAVAKLYKIENKAIIEAVRNFHGMPHRIQLVKNTGNRKFYNDSKATNITATATALDSFDQPIIYIGGGLDRGNEFDELIPHLSHVKKAFLYGETKEKMAKAFDKAKTDHVEVVENLSKATQKAYQAALPGDVVLFSPSCASWDQFPNYEIRGNQYMDIINQLVKDTPYQDE